MSDVKEKMKAMLPEIATYKAKIFDTESEVIDIHTFNRWLNDLLDGAVEMYGTVGSGGAHDFADDECQASTDTHRAILIGITPIKRGVSKEEIIRALKLVAPKHIAEKYHGLEDLVERIEREGIRHE